MALHVPAWMLDARDYGFPPDELARIRQDYPNVHVYVHGATGEYSVWARGDSGSMQPLCCLERHEFYKLHDKLHDMRYRAINRPLSSIADWADAEERSRVENRDAAVAAMDPDRGAWQLFKDHGKIAQVQVPAQAPV